LWIYRLRITQQPPPRVALIAGDVVHNTCSIFDHLAVALTGRRDAAFPIYYEDPWETTPDGSLMPQREKPRVRFESDIAGASSEAVEVIKELQPYNAGEDWVNHPLGIISKLDNADKHRHLIPTTSGVSDGTSHVARRSVVVYIFYWPFCDDGGEVARFGWDAPDVPDEPEVKVRVSGTPRVAIEISGRQGLMELTQGLRHMLDLIPDEVIAPLEALMK
jgi:hypothetical protein